jgi:predicted membrane protein
MHILYIYIYALGRASASLTVRTEIGLGTIYKFVGAIYKIEISILTEKRQIEEGGCQT